MQIRGGVSACRAVLTALLCLAVLMGGGQAAEGSAEWTDYAAEVRMASGPDTVRAEAEVLTYVDGDTTHFTVLGGGFSGVLKARYIGINTPESTGKIEPWGKQASSFTREKLSGAVSIVIESDDGNWNCDSTGGRYLVWVWYSEDGKTYRNLNIELLQQGLAIANASARNRYGDTCMAAISQARALKLNIYSGEKDPEFYYGDAMEVTLRELRINAGAYEGIKVAFQGVVTVNHNASVYVEALDGETGLHFGMPVYYGYSLSGGGLEILRPGNEVRIVGTLQYYEAGGAWQISGITYRMMKPDDPGNIRLLSTGHEIPWTPVDVSDLAHGRVSVTGEEETAEYDYAALVQATTVTVSSLSVEGGYTSDNGAMTLWCVSGGETLQVRADGAADADGNALTLEGLRGKTVTVRGIVGQFDGEYQINVLTPDGITIE